LRGGNNFNTSFASFTLKLGGTYPIGKDFKPFNLTAVSGKKYTQDNLKGKITFIEFWFEACSPCISFWIKLMHLPISYIKQPGDMLQRIGDHQAH
jgi:hypothetical protein